MLTLFRFSDSSRIQLNLSRHARNLVGRYDNILLRSAFRSVAHVQPLGFITWMAERITNSGHPRDPQNERHNRPLFRMFCSYYWCVQLILETISQQINASTKQCITGNSVKAGVRFVSYDHFKSMLADHEVSIHLHSQLDCRL